MFRVESEFKLILVDLLTRLTLSVLTHIALDWEWSVSRTGFNTFSRKASTTSTQQHKSLIWQLRLSVTKIICEINPVKCYH